MFPHLLTGLRLKYPTTPRLPRRLVAPESDVSGSQTKASRRAPALSSTLAVGVPGAHHFLAFDLRLSTFFRPSTLQLSTILVRLGRHSTTDSTGRTSIIVNVSKP